MTEQNDEDIQRLLEAAGPRKSPPPEVRARVHDQVLAAWEAMPEQKAVAGRFGVRQLAMAATILVAFVAGLIVVGRDVGPAAPQFAGVVAESSGNFTVSEITEQGQLAENAIVATTSGKVILSLTGGADVQMDRSTRLTVIDGASIALFDGRIYVDGGVAATQSLSVVTPHSVVTDVGTLFEVSVDGDAMTVAMREGEVTIDVGNQVTKTARVAAGLGDRLSFDRDQITQQNKVPTTDSRWQWVSQLRSPYETGEVTTYSYLEWAARDSGLMLEMSAIDEQQAKQDPWIGTERFGSSRGAIAEALQYTAFEMIRTNDHRLVVVDTRR